ncbi:MAG: protein-export membrane protein SecF [Candidatus Andersenbacteria bacterium RIFCSPHIGHO2_12_FULL_45_11b]|uniref:Protein-export membrane protein SecF n=1 Tax=Candidatus Andersenbacteria bacterium RIFCSPHIGHO2_12_FULL_45_11b TaxID=1797282 RepID=A0A1G1X996_9BACT|nr:MAG: protein-export membrane protein SecF [Candidatus Andersenbacteria bacterium RIFCSPHIGHO2_12_FULL_45_11b]
MTISAATIIASTLIIVIIKPNWGIDFIGGSSIEIQANAQDAPKAKELLASKFQLSAQTEGTQDGTIRIKTSLIDDKQHAEIITALREANILRENEISFEQIGPTIGKELRTKSIQAIGVVLVAMIIYLAYTFRSTGGLMAPWKFGVAAIYALIHDLFLVTACFVVFGKIWGAEIDTLFVTAQLAILGYSVNDTIVIFDRLRSEWLALRGKSFLEVIDRALIATMGRSINTMLTTLLSLAAALVFGGASIRWFIVALIIGVLTGVYSSIFVAPPLLYYISKRK